MSLQQGPFTDLQLKDLQFLDPTLVDTPLSTDNSGNVIAFNGFQSSGENATISFSGGVTASLNFGAVEFVQNGNSINYNVHIQFVMQNAPSGTAQYTFNILTSLPVLKTNFSSPNQNRSYGQVGTQQFVGLWQSGTASGQVSVPDLVISYAGVSGLTINMLGTWDATQFASGNVIDFYFHDFYFTN